MKRTLLALLVVLALWSSPAFAQVAFDAVGATAAGKSGVGVTTVDLTDLTIGAGSNRALVIQVAFIGTAGGGSAPTGVTWNWDQTGTPQALTQIGTDTTTANGQIVQLWGRVNPTSGNKTLRGSWTNSQEVVVQAVSWTGADQTGGTTTFAHFTSATSGAATTTPATVDITSATGNAVMAVTVGGTNVAVGAVNNTQTFLYHGSGNIEAGGNRADGAATVTMNCTWPGGERWVIAGVDIVAAGGAAAPKRLMTLGVGDE